jgi:hypothetical protein
MPQSNGGKAWGASEKNSQESRAFAKALSQLDDRKRKPILVMAEKMAGRREG